MASNFLPIFQNEPLTRYAPRYATSVLAGCVKRARPKLTLGVLGTKGVCENKKVKLEMSGKRTAKNKKKRSVLVCAGYAPGMRQGMRQVSEQDV